MVTDRLQQAFTVIRYPYRAGDLVASRTPETIVPDLPGFAQLRGGGHWTRDIVFTPDGKHMLISVGSASNADNADDHPNEFHRADVLEFTAEASSLRPMRPAFAIAWARQSILSTASFGVRPTSGIT